MRRLARRPLLLLMTGVAGLATAVPGLAQETPGQVFLPWQKPHSKPRPPPNMQEILPWLMGDDNPAPQAQAQNWDAEVDAPLMPVEPTVAEPLDPGARLETGGISPSGLVLKKPFAKRDNSQGGFVQTVAAEPAAAPAASPPPVQAPEPAAPAASSVADEKAAVAPASPTAADAGTTDGSQPDPSAPVVKAPALPEAEEAPPIPEPLPDATVTPVPAKAAETAPQSPAATPSPAAPLAAAASAASKPKAPDKLPDGANVAQQYCFNIADAAKDARYAWQKKTLADIEQELNKRIALLDERTAEYQKWLARRDEFIRTAEEGIIKIYTGMRPDTAAGQLSVMHEESAAAILAKINPRNASAILNDMEPAKAAKLTMIISGAARVTRRASANAQKTASEELSGSAAAPANAAPELPAAPQGGRS